MHITPTYSYANTYYLSHQAQNSKFYQTQSLPIRNQSRRAQMPHMPLPQSSQLPNGTSNIKFIPYDVKVLDYEDRQRIQLVPRVKKVIDYEEREIIEEIPKETTVIDYYAIEKQVAYQKQIVPEKSIEMVPVEKKVKKIEYIPMEKEPRIIFRGKQNAFESTPYFTETGSCLKVSGTGRLSKLRNQGKSGYNYWRKPLSSSYGTQTVYSQDKISEFSHSFNRNA